MIELFLVLLFKDVTAANTLITRDEFRRTFEVTGFAVPSNLDKQLEFLSNALPKARITTRRELAMFLANIYLESNGLVKKREPSPREESFYWGGYKYIGRGYIQLTHQFNYLSASFDIFGDDRLAEHPELVENDDLAWLTAAYFWRVYVHTEITDFDSTVRNINAPELTEAATSEQKQRLAHRREYYKEISGVLHVREGGTENECADIISQDEFRESFYVCQFLSPDNLTGQYDNFISAVNFTGIQNRTELAMFLANIYEESNGLLEKTEVLSANDKRYKGRGFIRLSDEINYRSASLSIFGDERLFGNPEMVENDEVAWLTSAWFWQSKVHFNHIDFQSTVQLIHPKMLSVDQSEKGYACYENILKLLESNGSSILTSDEVETNIKSKQTRKATLIGGILGSLSILTAAACVAYLKFFRRDKVAHAAAVPELLFFERTNSIPPILQFLEVPRAKLAISDTLLGSGYFGVVYLAEMSGGKDGTERKTVAVKTLKKEDALVKAQFVAEMRLMAMLGRHLNIVNLLGVTFKGELRLILEYCQHGSLRSFLRTNSNRIASAKSQAPETEGDYTGTVSEINSATLVAFAYQIVRGMVYLSHRNIVHRDLAARNILVCKDLILKISDFGLAIETSAEEFSSEWNEIGINFALKWMAPESLKHRIFNQLTDVWSYGITLWEIFSVGETPYKNVATTECLTDFLALIESGYQLERPQGTPDFIYDIMQNCWCQKAKARPTFLDIRIALQEQCVEDYYLSLGSEYDDFNSLHTILLDKQTTDVNEYGMMLNHNQLNKSKSIQDSSKGHQLSVRHSCA